MKLANSYFLRPQLPKVTEELWNAYQPKIDDEAMLQQEEEAIEKALAEIKFASAQPIIGKSKENSSTAPTGPEEEEVEEEEEEEELADGDEIISADRFTLAAAIANTIDSFAESVGDTSIVDTSIDATALDSSIDDGHEVMDF